MRWIAGLTLFGICALAVTAEQGDPVKDELKKLAGKWQNVTYVQNGKAEPAEENKRFTWEQDMDGNFKLLKDGQVYEEGKQNELDATKNPKTINSLVTVGENKGMKLVGIYRFVGDTVEICWANQGQARPTEFESKAGSNHTFEVWKRVK